MWLIIILAKGISKTKVYKKGYTLDQIADVAETSVEVVDAIIKKKEPAMA